MADETAPAAAEETTAPETTEPTPAPAGRTVKVDGVERTLTKEEEDQVFAQYQKYMAGDKRLAEASKAQKNLEKLAQDLVGQLRNDPFSLLAHPDFGVDVDAQIAAYQQRREAEKSMSEEQKQLREAQARLQQYEEEQARLYHEYANHMVSETLRLAKIPANSESVRRAAFVMDLANKAGLELTPEQISKEVVRTYVDDFLHFAQELPEEDFETHFGAMSSKALKAVGKKAKAAAAAPAPKEEAKPGKPISLEEAALRYKKKYGV